MGNPNKTGGGFDEQTNAEADSREKEIRSIIKGNIDIIANVDSVGVLDKYSEEIDEAEEGGKSGIRPDEFKLMRDAISKRRTELAEELAGNADNETNIDIDNSEADDDKRDEGEEDDEGRSDEEGGEESEEGSKSVASEDDEKKYRDWQREQLEGYGRLFGSEKERFRKMVIKDTDLSGQVFDNDKDVFVAKLEAERDEYFAMVDKKVRDIYVQEMENIRQKLKSDYQKKMDEKIANYSGNEAEEGGKSGIYPDEFKLMRDAINKRRTELALIEKEVSDVDDVLSDDEISDDNRVDNAEQVSEKMDVGEVITDNDEDKRRKEADAVLDDWLHGGSEKYSHYIINDEEDEAESDGTEVKSAYIAKLESERDEKIDKINRDIDRDLAIDKKAMDRVITERKAEGTITPEFYNNLATKRGAYIAEKEAERQQRIEEVQRDFNEKIANYSESGAEDEKLVPVMEEAPASSLGGNGNMGTVIEGETWASDDGIAEEDETEDYSVDVEGLSFDSLSVASDILKGLRKSREVVASSDDDAAEEDKTEVDVEGASSSSLDVALDILKGLKENTEETLTDEDESLRPVVEVPASSIIKDNDGEIAKPESWEDEYVSSFDEAMRDYANHGGDEDEYNAKLKTLAEDFKKQGDWEFYGGKRTFEEYVHSLPRLVDRYLQSWKQKQKSIEKVIKKFDREDLEGMPLDRMTDALKIALADSRQISKFEECSKMLKEQYKKLGVREDGSLDDEAKKTSKFRKVADAIRRVIRLESE